MIRDDITTARIVVQSSLKMVTAKQDGTSDHATGYRQGVMDLAGELLYPDLSWPDRRERLAELYAAHKALFVEVPL